MNDKENVSGAVVLDEKVKNHILKHDESIKELGLEILGESA